MKALEKDFVVQIGDRKVVPLTRKDLKERTNIPSWKIRDMEEFFEFHFPVNEKIDGNVLVFKRDQFTLDSGKPVRFNRLVVRRPLSKVKGVAYDTAWYKELDYIVGKNTFSANKCKPEQVLSFNNIVIDYDIYSDRLTLDDIIDRVNYMIFFVAEVWNKIEGYPKVNTIVFSPKGVHLWFATESLTYKLKDVYLRVAGWICDELDKKVKEYPELRDFYLDRATSSRAAGLVCVPGTYNPSADVWTDFYHLSDERIDLMEFDREIRQKTNYKNKPIESRYIPRYKNRVNFFIELQELRRETAEPGKETRDLFLFCLYCASRYEDTYTHEEAMELVHKMNANFIEPLEEHLVMEYLAPAIRKGGYDFSWHDAVHSLHITEEDVETILTRRNASRAKKPRIKEEQKTEVLRLHKNHLTQQEIADKVGISLFSVNRLIHASGLETENDRRKKRIWEALDRGYTDEEIAKREHVHKQTVSNHRKKWLKAKEAEKQKEPQKSKKPVNKELEKKGKKLLEDLQKKQNFLKKITSDEIHEALEKYMPILRLREYIYSLFFGGIPKENVAEVAVAEMFLGHDYGIADIDRDALKNDLEEYIKIYQPGETILSLIRKESWFRRDTMTQMEIRSTVDEMKEFLTVTDMTGGKRGLTKRLKEWANERRERLMLNDWELNYCIKKATKTIQNRLDARRDRRAKKRYEKVVQRCVLSGVLRPASCGFLPKTLF